MTIRKDRPSVLDSLGIRKNTTPKQPKPSNESALVEKRMRLLSDLTASQGSRELLSAARSGDVARARYLLTSVPTTDVNFRSSASEDSLGKGAQALHFAALGGHSDVCAALLESGAAPLAATDAGCTALHVAAKRGHASTAKCLLSCGGALLRVAKDNLGRTALWYASRGQSKGHLEIAKMLK